MKKRKPVSDRRLRAAALTWAKAKLRVMEVIMSGETTMPDRGLRNALDAATTELLRLCVKLMAAKGKA
jgi:hypothetical protein